MRIFLYFKKEGETDGAQALLFSIIFAVIHGMMELFVLYIESEIYEQPFMEYFIVCFNGMLGWTPRVNKFRDPEFTKKHTGKKKKPMDYDDLSKDLKMLNFKFDFQFSDQTAFTLAQGLSRMQLN